MTGSETFELFVIAIGFGTIVGFAMGALLYWKG